MPPFSHHHAPELYARLTSSLLPMPPAPHHHAPELYARLISSLLPMPPSSHHHSASRTDQALVEGKQRFPLGLFLLLDHGIKAADSVLLQPTHRPAPVQDKNDLCQILSHMLLLSETRPLGLMVTAFASVPAYPGLPSPHSSWIRNERRARTHDQRKNGCPVSNLAAIAYRFSFLEWSHEKRHFPIHVSSGLAQCLNMQLFQWSLSGNANLFR